MPRLLLALLAWLLLAGCATLPRPDGAPGPSLRDGRLLDASPDTLRIELDRVDGSEPRPEALAQLLRALDRLTDKARFELIVDDVIPTDQYEAGDQRIRYLAAAHRSRGDRELRANLHLLYAPRWASFRGYAWMRSAMQRHGTEYDAALVVVFADALEPIAWITGVRQEASVLVHEVGHTFGLATDPGHSHDGHCTNAWCSVYDGVDARSALLYFWPTLLTGYLPLDYCGACRADLESDR